MDEPVLVTGIPSTPPERWRRGTPWVGHRETKDILATIEKPLSQAGSDKSKLLTANIWPAHMATFDEMNQAGRRGAAGQTPARATVQAQRAHPDDKIEIMVTAARSRGRRRCTSSSWAPAWSA